MRVARLNRSAGLEAHYTRLCNAADDPGTATTFSDPLWPGAQPRERAILRHVDLVTRSPRDATAADISALRDAGIDDPDIVRLSGLISFLAFQVRLLAGLELMKARA